ncbi:MAG: GGDEF domain-containing protein [Deltaproteobacteria bacterium]|nr:GGDEF domain-containing protein [Deltaproteobacteria bacterium]
MSAPQRPTFFDLHAAIAVLQQIDCGIFVVNKEMRLLEWNQKMTTLSGVNRKSALGTDVFSLLPDDKKSGVQRKLKAVFALGKQIFLSHEVYSHLLYVPLNRMVGQHAPCMKQDCTFFPILNNEGEIVAACATLFDATAQYLAKQELEVANAQLKQDIGKDALTGLKNRGYLMEQLKRTYAEGIRHGAHSSVMLLDVDHFKNMNDTEGHLAGDEVLRCLARCMSEAVREEDIVARYGGEEFCVILPNTDLAGAEIVSERVREAVQDMEILFEDRVLQITVSIGVAPFALERKKAKSAGKMDDGDEVKVEDDPITRILMAADEALYEAKDGGRNRVCCAR